MTTNAANTPSLTQALKAIASGESTAEDIINLYFDRIEEREEAVGAWQFRLSREEYLQAYKDNQTWFEQSLLKGLPVGIKDIIDTADMPTEMGSPIHSGRQPIEDATCVALLKQAGAIVLGKTVTTEFAYFKPGKTCNPADLSRTPGGSSSGSAAAVADGMVPVALGSQTAASVIRPAAYCGANGYVGSRGEYSLRGGQPLAQSLDSLGLFSKSMDDLALLRSILLRQQPKRLAESKAPKILLVPGELFGECSEDTTQALSNLANQLKSQGAEILTLDNSAILSELVDCHIQIMSWEVCRNLVLESLQPEKLSDPLKQLMEDGMSMDRDTYTDALNRTGSIQQWIEQTYPDIDAILTPAAPGIAPLGQDKTGSPHMSRPWQAMGLPVVSLIGIESPEKLPIGLQLVGKYRQDDQLLIAANWVQSQIKNV